MLPSDPHEFQAQAIEEGRNLSSAWRTYWAKHQHLESDRLSDSSLAVIAGLAAHVDKLAEQGFNLIEQGEWLVAMPLVRTAYECAIRAQWLQQVPDAGKSFLAEDSRQMKNFLKTLTESDNATMLNAAGAMAHRVVDEFGKSTAQAKRFDKACDDLDGAGVEAYAYYRAMSTYCHPSVILAEQYMEDHGHSVRLLDTAKSDGAGAWAALLSASLVWATAVVEFSARDAQFKREIRRAATALSAPFVMQPSPEARRRSS